MIYGKDTAFPEDKTSENQCLIVITPKGDEYHQIMINLLQYYKFPLNSLYSEQSLNIYAHGPSSSSFSKLIHIDEVPSLSRCIKQITSHTDNFIAYLLVLLDDTKEMNTKKIENFQSKISSIRLTVYITNSSELFMKELQKSNFNIKLADYSKTEEIANILKEVIEDKKKNDNSNNYLSKKRKPIFSIQKVPHSGLYSNPRNNYSNISFNHNDDCDILRKEDIDYNDNSYNEEGDGTSRNSLISISKEVFKYIKAKIQTKGSDVTNHILSILTTKGNKLNYKNIQRRVYDAINVMSAIGIISKDKGTITYLQNNLSSYNGTPFNDDKTQATPNIEEADEEIEKLNNSIKQKQNMLMQQCSQNYFYYKFMHMNQSDIKRNSTVDKLDFPFYILALNNESKYSIKQVDFNNRVVILANQPFKIIDPENLIKFFIKNDFIKGNVRKYFNAELANYLIENKLIESYFNNTTSDFENYNNTNNNFKDSNKNSYSFSQKLFEPISILDSDNNKFNSIDIRKGSEDLSNFNYYPSSFNFQRGEDSYDMMENPEKAFSNHLSPYFKH